MSLAPGPGADSGSQEDGRYETVSALTIVGLACANRGQPSCGSGLLRRLTGTPGQDTGGVTTPLKEARRSS
jgi:hypothetical protein